MAFFTMEMDSPAEMSSTLAPSFWACFTLEFMNGDLPPVRGPDCDKGRGSHRLRRGPDHGHQGGGPGAVLQLFHHRLEGGGGVVGGAQRGPHGGETVTVFREIAKSDIQPILNQGGRKEDVAASIFQAVVDQTVAGLTQGRELKGKIVFLGGPLHFLMGLRQRFVETLKLDGEHAVFPEDGDCFAAMGAALCIDRAGRRPEQ